MEPSDTTMAVVNREVIPIALREVARHGPELPVAGINVWRKPQQHRIYRP
jgi:hypothetical protein